MRTFVLSDIHGNNKLFRKALKTVHLKKEDKLIIIGDLIDRGFDSKGVLDTIILLREHGFNVKCLLGNHEQLFLNALQDRTQLNKWLLNGGDKTLSSFLTSSVEKIPPKYIKLIKEFDLFYEIEEFIFVHATLNMTIDDPYSDIHTILWERDSKKYFDESWLADRILIHGHNPTNQNVIIESILNKEKILCIDNGTYLNEQHFGSQCILQLDNFKVNFINENN